MNHMEPLGGSGIEHRVSIETKVRGNGKNTEGREWEREMMKTVRNGNYRNG